MAVVQFKNDSETGERLIPIPVDRMNDYNRFLKMFNKEDDDESREKFLNM